MQAAEIKLQLTVDPSLPPVVEGSVCFETGARPDQVGPLVYEHHGEGFSADSPGSLARFFEDLTSGMPLPPMMVLHDIAGPDSVLACALFLKRDLLIHPATPGLVYSVDFVHRRGSTFFGHLDPGLARFLRALGTFFPQTLPKRERAERLGTAIEWVKGFLFEGTLPNIGPLPAETQLIDIGTNGFVVATTESPSEETWDNLFRQGFLRGVLLGPEDSAGLRQVVAARKHEQVGFDLLKAETMLNDLEILSGNVEEKWSRNGHFLHSPASGTSQMVSLLMEVFLRV